MLGGTQVERALDVACGTGMSTTALARDRRRRGRRRPFGRDARSRRARRSRRELVRSTAETLAVPRSRSFDAVTCQLRRPLVRPAAVLRGGAPAPAARRLGRALRPLLHRRDGRRRRVPGVGRRSHSTAIRCRRAIRRSVIRVPRRPRASISAGDEFYADDIDMIAAAVRRLPAVDQQLRGGVRTRHAARRAARVWLFESTAPFYADAECRTVRFLGSLTCLRVATE